MKMYDYLISYTFNAAGYLTPSNGVIKLSRKKKIKTFDDVSEVCSYITAQIDGASNLAINNIILLGRNKH